jgi:16S rRNA (adenine1518-N6/adenine1519-N6)-dimethyltransferase
LHNQDILSFNVGKQVQGKYKVVSNIPYYLTSHLFQYFLDLPQPPQAMVFLVQKEVGERVTAGPGEMSVLAVSIQLRADAELVYSVPRKSFWPSPKVDSVVIKLKPRVKYPQVTDHKLFFRIVKVAFAAKRKQLHNNLANGMQLSADQVAEWLSQNKIDPKVRAQDLSMDDWVHLYQTYPVK